MTADDLPHQVRGSMRLMLGVLRQALEDIFHHACHKYGSNGAKGGAQHGVEHGGEGVVASAEDTKAAVLLIVAREELQALAEQLSVGLVHRMVEQLAPCVVLRHIFETHEAR